MARERRSRRAQIVRENRAARNIAHSDVNLVQAVSYEEYFRQIFGLSGSKKVVENIPRKYYLGNMGSVLDRFLWEQKVAKKVKVLWQLLVGNFGQ